MPSQPAVEISGSGHKARDFALVAIIAGVILTTCHHAPSGDLCQLQRLRPRFDHALGIFAIKFLIVMKLGFKASNTLSDGA